LGKDRKRERYGIYDIIYFSLIFSALFSPLSFAKIIYYKISKTTYLSLFSEAESLHRLLKLKTSGKDKTFNFKNRLKSEEKG